MTETPDRIGVPPFPLNRPTGCPFDPAAEYAPLRDLEGPVEMSTPAGVNAWVFTRFDDVRRVLADPRLSSRLAPSAHAVPGADLDRQIGTAAILQDDGEHHLRLRRLLASEFTIKRMEALRPRIAQLIEDRLDSMLRSDRPVDLVEVFALPIPSLVICELLGVPYEERDQFQHRSAILGTVDRRPEELERAGVELGQYAAGLVLARQAKREDDLLSRLITRAEEQGDALAVPELVSIVLTLLIAGHETTANMIALSTLALLGEPELLRTLRHQPEISAQAVEEMLRYLSVLQFGLFRQIEDDIPLIHSTPAAIPADIKAGEYLIAALPAANRDDRVFPDPDRIDLTRQGPAHLAFGFGRHQCLGQQLARVMLQEVFNRLFRRIPTLRLAVPVEQIRFKDNAMTYGVATLPVTWERESHR
ncbi:cytochrome P450 [Kribbella sp. CA-294648]|uniref:cytochrome P450 n=1 Tax=Kribbella sp. CA-294648 TaxID=3239948 RepID=UPI003D925417